MAEAGGKGRARTQPGGIAPRQLALDLLEGVWDDGLLLSEMEVHPHFAGAPAEVRARAGRLARATLRQAGRAEAALKPFMKRRPTGTARTILLLATVEMLSEGEAAHGVVNSAVALANRHQKSAAAMVNAVLRKVAEGGSEAWGAAQPQRLPNWLRGRVGGAYGNARVDLMEAAFERAAPLDVTAKSDPGAVAEQLDGEVLPTGSVRLSQFGKVSALPGFEAGDWWVQDAAAALPALVLAPQPGERVLDICAAPGGKTLQIAAAGADVTALDVSDARLARLRQNLTRTGLSAGIVAADALEWEAETPFDAILLDAPCSATGTIRRHPDLPFVKDSAGIKPLFDLQAALIDRAADLLKPGGRLVFCTCSLLPEEGETQVSALLDRRSDLTPDEAAISALTGLEENWRAGAGALRTTPEMWPERGGLDGFFIAALRKT